MKRHAIRSTKYFIWMIILFTIIFAIMSLTGTTAVKGIDGIKAMFATQGPMLLVVLVVMAIVFPLAGYASRTIEGTVSKENIVDTLGKQGFKLASYTDNTMIFRATNPLKKFGMYFEDRIEVSLEDGKIKLDGMRKEIFKIEYRLNTMLEPKQD